MAPLTAEQVVRLPAMARQRVDGPASSVTSRGCVAGRARRTALLPAVALLCVAAIAITSSLHELFVSPRSSDQFRSSSSLRLRAAAAEGEEKANKPKPMVFQPAPAEEQPGMQPTSEDPNDPESGKRLRQFLALEPLDDAPEGGNQWEADMNDTQLTPDEARKKTTAIVTIVISLALGFLYLIGVYFIENREFQSEVTLSADDVARLSGR
eukprot:TRINITY_DN91121_c0_g1_i1.p1 TRINITY_DN91121_c0_g1~~TRINITY_DN91121_c0_g1_i1.p1  ORF type:complete len:227 (+),score=41.96 TRINITY_DN91121_c0_g1_i1:54-683(+)